MLQMLHRIRLLALCPSLLQKPYYLDWVDLQSGGWVKASQHCWTTMNLCCQVKREEVRRCLTQLSTLNVCGGQ